MSGISFKELDLPTQLSDKLRIYFALLKLQLQCCFVALKGPPSSRSV